MIFPQGIRELAQIREQESMWATLMVREDRRARRSACLRDLGAQVRRHIAHPRGMSRSRLGTAAGGEIRITSAPMDPAGPGSLADTPLSDMPCSVGGSPR
jgi:hypothetical protein